MIFPLDSLLVEHRELGLVVAVGIGFAFGFVLERAGFGRATKLAAQFYGHDMTVFKVMFGAIVTAMLGIVVVSGLGLADLGALSASIASPTFLWPMLVGGLLLGAGFIISGYCPGTAVVATASGNLDGLVSFVGVVAGSLLFSLGFPLIEGFYVSGAVGHLFLYEWLGIPPAALAAGVTAMALGCFVGAEMLEKYLTTRRTGKAPERAPKRLAWSALGVVTVIGLATMFFPVAPAESATKQAASIDSEQLARRILDEPWRLRILDIREKEFCARARIPGAECTPAGTLKELGLAFSPGVRDLVIVAKSDLASLPGGSAAYPGRVYLFKGGFDAWKAYALEPPEPPAAGASPVELEAYRFRSAVHRSVTGSRVAPPPPTGTIKYVPKKRKKTGGCG
jgi:hypothetical protein